MEEIARLDKEFLEVVSALTMVGMTNIANFRLREGPPSITTKDERRFLVCLLSCGQLFSNNKFGYSSGARGFYPFNKPQFARRASNSSMYCYLESGDLQGLRVGLSACYRCFELGHSRCIHLAGRGAAGKTSDFLDEFQPDIDETDG